MDRRAFLKMSAVAAAAGSLPWRDAVASVGDWRSYEITTKVTILKPRGGARAWIPLPMTDDTPWQTALGNSWSGNSAKAQIHSDGKYGAAILAAEWRDGESAPLIEVTSRCMTRDRATDFTRPDPKAEKLSAAEVAFYTAPTEWIPTDGIVRDTARDIVKGTRGDIERARAIYEWVVDNTFRDPKTRGCGWGDIKTMLETRNYGGKCGDLNAMFVGLARSAGLPARDVYGIRVAPSVHGYKSLGAGAPVISRAQHCRAEFFAPGFGWVPVDPADVRKVVLEEPPANLKIDDSRVVAARKRLFGGWEMNWLAYNMAHDVALPGSAVKAPKLPYLMYVNGETGGERLDPLEPDSFRYEIRTSGVKA
ncbi:MAG: transglutaminase [Betaproteobacteria bacterium RIFCSPLOWO2_12_FULL_67_28]|nr:MAG: transglutaminase [Betaproteobacteria bacterium RIFCSPLOWO2_12_FULL_67_28]